MAEKPTLDELVERAVRALAAPAAFTAEKRRGARKVLEAAGVPALLERAERAEREEGKTLQAAWDSLGDMLERAEAAEARVAQLEAALREIQRLGTRHVPVLHRGGGRSHRSELNAEACVARAALAGEPQVGRDRHSAEGDPALPDPSKSEN